MEVVVRFRLNFEILIIVYKSPENSSSYRPLIKCICICCLICLIHRRCRTPDWCLCRIVLDWLWSVNPGV